jgi:hypothetical protein
MVNLRSYSNSLEFSDLLLYVCAQVSLSNLEHVKKLVGVDAYFFIVLMW